MHAHAYIKHTIYSILYVFKEVYPLIGTVLQHVRISFTISYDEKAMNKIFIKILFIVIAIAIAFPFEDI